MNTVEKQQLARSAQNGNLNDLGKALDELSNPTSPVALESYTVANAPAAASFTGHVIYVSNGAAGNPILAFSDGTNWLRCDTAAAIAAA